jgi:hypothetical protein
MTVEWNEVRISAVSYDWVDKGCHVHVGRNKIEVSLRPSYLGGIVYRPVFASSEPDDVDAAVRILHSQLLDKDRRLLRRLRGTVKRARDYLIGVEGKDKQKARGKLYEMRRLEQIFERMEQSS